MDELRNALKDLKITTKEKVGKGRYLRSKSIEDILTLAEKLSNQNVIIDMSKMPFSWNCRFHPIDSWHEIGCSHRDWSMSELLHALKINTNPEAKKLLKEQIEKKTADALGFGNSLL